MPTMYKWIPNTPESFTYDKDGIFHEYGRFSYTYDSRNRFKNVMLRSAVYGPPRHNQQFTYDQRDRKRRAILYQWLNGNCSNICTTVYVYDGWINGEQSPSHLRRATATFKPTHRVGARRRSRRHSGNCYGNVLGLADASTESAAARYDYGPFGETVRRLTRQAATSATDEEFEAESDLQERMHQLLGSSIGSIGEAVLTGELPQIIYEPGDSHEN